MPTRRPESSDNRQEREADSRNQRAVSADFVALHDDEIQDLLKKHFGGFWIGGGPGPNLPEHALFAQFKQAPSGRRVLTGLLLMGDAVTADVLRKIPVALVENSGNLSHTEARKQLTRARRGLQPLKRQPGQTPEEFSRLVAEHYKLWASLVPHPALSIAEEHSVPIPTVHTWIREARLRGFLPPGNRKKTSENSRRRRM
jgi:hypothetical protein